MLRAINNSLSRVFGRSTSKRDELDGAQSSTSTSTSSPAGTAQTPTAQTTVVLGDWGIHRDQMIRSVMASCFGKPITAKDRAAYAAQYRQTFIQGCQSVCSTVYWDNENHKKGLNYAPKVAWEWSTPAVAELAEKIRSFPHPADVTSDESRAQITKIFLDCQTIMADPLIAQLKADASKSWMFSVQTSIAEAGDAAWMPTDEQINQMHLLDNGSSEVLCQKPDSSSGILSQLIKCEMSGGRGGYAWSWVLPSIMKLGPMDIILMLPVTSTWELNCLDGYLQGCTALSHALVTQDFSYLGRKPPASNKKNNNKRKTPSRRLPTVVIALCGTDAELTEALKTSTTLPKDAAEARSAILRQAVASLQPLTDAGGVVLTSVCDPLNTASVAKIHQSLVELHTVELPKAPARAVQLQLALNKPDAALEVVVPAAPIEIAHIAAEA